MTTHNFESSKAVGQSSESREIFRRAYHDLVPGGRPMWHDDRNELKAQILGRDCTLVRPDGESLWFDEKVDMYDNDRIVLEYVSNDQKSTPGWIEKSLAIHGVMYLKTAQSMCYPFWWPLLQRAWRLNKETWLKWAIAGENGFWHSKAQNREGYSTLGVCVPADKLTATCNTGSGIFLPTARVA